MAEVAVREQQTHRGYLAEVPAGDPMNLSAAVATVENESAELAL